ncbi:MAG: membrane protein insertion efficiency factor YidD [Melioribacteraceae bacterium]|nr:membrane protein insertion efficiency factor YidD [Melioribacteraceae bacterium]
MRSHFIILFLLVLLPTINSAQPELKKWQPVKINYELKANEEGSNYSTIGIFAKTLSGTKTLYKFFISDLDGDNCPFHPSCSEFYVESVSETGLFKGTFMFIDRFTRDLNFFKSREQYKVIKNNKFYDPVEYYISN